MLSSSAMKNIILLSLFILCKFCSAQDVIIEIPQGLLTGTTDTDRNGNEYLKFLNIPFAKPPVGDLRFRVSILNELTELL